MPKAKDKSYNERVLEFCKNEKELRDLIGGDIFGQHGQEKYIVDKFAEMSKDRNIGRVYIKSLADDIRGGFCLTLAIAEIYRVLVEEKAIEPVNMVKLASRIGMTPKAAKLMRDLSRQAMAEFPKLEGVLDEDYYTIASINDDVDDEGKLDALLDKIMEDAVEAAFESLEDDEKKKGGKHA